MLSPRSSYITLLKQRKRASTQKFRNIWLTQKKADKKNNKPQNNEEDSRKYILSREKSSTKLRKSLNKNQNTSRQSASKIQVSSSRGLSKQKSRIDIFSQTCLTARHESSQQNIKKNKQGQNCRMVIKSNGKSQADYFLKIKQISQVRKFLFSIIPEAKNFVTIPRQLSLEYLLTQQNVNGQFLNGQSLYFKIEVQRQSQKIRLSSKICLQDFEILKQLGAGGFSNVFLCRSKIDNNFYAMKLINKDMVVKNSKKGIVTNQRNIMTQSHHPFIIQLKYAFESQKYIIFVLEYCAGGQLFGLLKRYGRLSEEIARFYVIEVLLGLSYLHSQKVVYRDIKPQNILIGIDGHIKIADLGLAKPNMNQGVLAHSFCGSPQYMAPQMILQVGHTYPVDFYCVGALLYELLTGLPPFYSQYPNQIYQAVIQQQLTFPSDIPLTNQCKSLLKSLLCKDSKFRLGSLHGSKEILAHPWFGKQNYNNFISKNVKPPITFNSLERLNLDVGENEQYAQNCQKVLKNQKTQSNQWKNIMNNFYYDFRGETAISNLGSLQLKQRNNSARNFSPNKIGISERKSSERQNNEISENIKKRKKKNAFGLPLQSSLQHFFKK